jgi:hypothetical protein
MVAVVITVSSTGGNPNFRIFTSENVRCKRYNFLTQCFNEHILALSA